MEYFDGCGSLLRSICWPSPEDVNDDSTTTSELFEPVLSPINEPLDHSLNETPELRDLRSQGYNLIIDLYQKATRSQQVLISEQWRQFDRQLSDLLRGDIDRANLHLSPSDIHFYGEEYGSFAEQVMTLISLLNSKDSPFHLVLPRLPKPTDRVPPENRANLAKVPSCQRRVEQEHHRSVLECMLAPTITKSGAKNELTILSLEKLIGRLDRFLRQAQLLDEVNHQVGQGFDQTDRMCFLVQEALARLNGIKNELFQYLNQSRIAHQRMIESGMPA